MFDSLKLSGIGYCTCGNLKKKEKLSIYEPIEEKNIKNLKYLKNNIELKFWYDDYENIFKCINFLNNKYKKITINVENKKKFNEFISKINLNKLILNKIFIDQPMVLTTLKDYIYYENILYKMVEPAKKLSPLEKYIYVYNIVKNYKEYKECKENKAYSRQLYRILFNDFIVCVGFSELLSDLLNKLDINNYILSVMIDSKKVKGRYITNHERLYIYLKDEKYKINGYYLSDPTWDNYLDYDLYTYMLFTNSKNDLAKHFQYDDKFIIFNVNSLEEFYYKYNELKNKFELKDEDIINYLLSILKNLEPNIYNELKNNYNNKLILEKIGNHLLKKVNKDINKKKIWKGVRTIYSKSYGYKNVCVMNDEINKVINYNLIREKNSFYNNINQKVLKKIDYKNSPFL